MIASIDSVLQRDAHTLWDYHCIYDPLRDADAVIGLGSYDLRVAERCAALFAEGRAPRIVFTGHAGNWTGGLYETSEAAAFAAHAVSLDVPRDAITLEERATNIGENVRYTAELLANVRSVILVTKPQTQRRCRATALKQWQSVDAMVTAPVHGYADQPTADFDEAHLICEMVGDIHRMRTYPALGYQVPQDVPADVSKAYDRLVAAGFIKHLPDDAD